MVRVTILKTRHGKYAGFNTSGHAEYSEGPDIVCAACSVLVINTINAIETFTDDLFHVSSNQETGEIRFRFESVPAERSTLLIDSLVLGLQSMEESSEYGPYIDVIIREV